MLNSTRYQINARLTTKLKIISSISRFTDIAFYTDNIYLLCTVRIHICRRSCDYHEMLTISSMSFMLVLHKMK